MNQNTLGKARRTRTTAGTHLRAATAGTTVGTHFAHERTTIFTWNDAVDTADDDVEPLQLPARKRFAKTCPPPSSSPAKLTAGGSEAAPDTYGSYHQ